MSLLAKRCFILILAQMMLKGKLATVREVKKISFGENVLYEPESGLRGLSEDETAIAALMIDTAKYSRGEGEPPYSMEDAFADAYAAILLNEAVRTGKKVRSCDINGLM